MAKLFQSIRGMNDLLPAELSLWQYLEQMLRDLARRYGYQEIRFPIVEPTSLFKRTVGEVTDIVEKEMYTFDDRNGDSLSLRPEGTASCVRAALQHSLLQGVTRLWYMGPMYRRERPQKGRYRQFHQFSVETFGVADAAMELEQLLMIARLFSELGLRDKVQLELNSLGEPSCRAHYTTALVSYLKQHQSKLDQDALRRLDSNPLRILDSKNPDLQDLLLDAPKIDDYWSEHSRQHFDLICDGLSAAGVSFKVNSRLVRGLDYYSHTVYEWVSTELGAQGTVCAGGRYDSLVETLGGKPTPAVGFSVGLERLVLLLEQQMTLTNDLDVYMILVGEAALNEGLNIAEQLRSALPQLRLAVNCQGGSFKAQFKRADKSGARNALIIGEDELAKQQVALKPLRERSEQRLFSLPDLIAYFKEGLLNG